MASWDRKTKITITVEFLLFFLLLFFPSKTFAAPKTESETPLLPEVSAEPESSSDSEELDSGGFDSMGSYHAALGLQTASYRSLERFGYYAKNPDGVYCPYGEENWKKLTRKKERADVTSIPFPDNRMVVSGNFTDVELKGNGTYMLTLDHADFRGATCISQLHIATDIPKNNQIQITDIMVFIDDTECMYLEDAIWKNGSEETDGGMVVLLLNREQEELKEQLAALDFPESNSEGWEFLTGKEEERISVIFTISGFDYDNEDAFVSYDPSSIEKMVVEDIADNPIKDTESGRLSMGTIVGFILVILAAGITEVVIRKKH